MDHFNELHEKLMNEPMAWRHRRRQALERIVDLYEAWGKPEEARTWRARLDVPSHNQEVLDPP